MENLGVCLSLIEGAGELIFGRNECGGGGFGDVVTGSRLRFDSSDL